LFRVFPRFIKLVERFRRFFFNDAVDQPFSEVDSMIQVSSMAHEAWESGRIDY